LIFYSVDNFVFSFICGHLLAWVRRCIIDRYTRYSAFLGDKPQWGDIPFCLAQESIFAKSMKCPFCSQAETRVIDSRDVNDGRAIRRRRECEKCSRRFTTYEEIEALRLTVLKRSGEKQEYDREKLLAGIQKSLEKRPVAEDQVEKMLSEIEYQLHSKHAKEVSSREIGRLVMTKLKEVDEVAYLRFASVYKSFGSASSFQKEIDKLNT